MDYSNLTFPSFIKQKSTVCAAVSKFGSLYQRSHAAKYSFCLFEKGQVITCRPILQTQVCLYFSLEPWKSTCDDSLIIALIFFER